MTDSSHGPTPIFLFSLPRSGSTLLQRILGAHSDIATANEPHILLPFLHSLKEHDVYSTYEHQYVTWAIQDFAATLSGGTDEFLQGIRELVIQLYAKAAGRDVRYFLDKTPRYFMVIEDIFRLFPEAKMIFLWRNPLSVVSSLMKAWQQGVWCIYHYEYYLFLGLENLTAAYQKYSGSSCSVRYEELILNPEPTVERVFEYLGLAQDPAVLTHFHQVELPGRLGDPHRHDEGYQVLRRSPLTVWRDSLANPLRRAWCRRYLQWIGPDRLAIMGYDLDALSAELDSLPFSLHFLASDLYKMPYGKLYPWIEGRMLKHKIQAWRKGQRIYVHK